jgi:hypothetical protein
LNNSRIQLIKLLKQIEEGAPLAFVEQINDDTLLAANDFLQEFGEETKYKSIRKTGD